MTNVKNKNKYNDKIKKKIKNLKKLQKLQKYQEPKKKILKM